MGERKRKHVCIVCHKAVHTKPAYVSHLLSHSEIRCSGCQESFASSYSLRNHQLRHTQVMCLICDEIFPLLVSLQQHMMTMHASYMCGVCQASLTSATSLESHLLTHVNKPGDNEEASCPKIDPSVPSTQSEILDDTIKNLEVSFNMSSVPSAYSLLNSLEAGCSGVSLQQKSNSCSSPFEDLKSCDPEHAKGACDESQDNEGHIDTNSVDKYAAPCAEIESINVSGLIYEVKQELDDSANDDGFPDDASFYEGRDKSVTVKLESDLMVSRDVEGCVRCKICKQDFTSATELELHMKSHDIDKLYRCKICSARFRYAVALRRHVATHVERKTKTDTCTNDKPYKCFLCSTTFSTTRLLDQHNYTHTGKRPFKCNECDQAFMKSQSLKHHIKSHTVKTGTSRYCCGKCGEVFSTLDGLDEHVWSHLGEGAYQCDVCQQQFNLSRSLVIHISTVHSNKGSVSCGDPYVCNECGESFESIKILEAHIHIHRATQPFHCNLCSHSFSDLDTLKTHTNIHAASSSTDSLKCGICLKPFSSAFYLNSHVRRHLARREYKCPLCSKQLVHARSLKQHMQSHSFRGSHTCLLCLSVFKTKTALFIHSKKDHSEQMPYKCDYCGRGFFIKGRMLNHRLSHNGARNFSCEDCQLGFDTEGAYTKHMWKKHGKKTNCFVCDICNRQMRTEHSLKEHYRTHTGEKPYMCDICGKCFTQQQMLTSHRRLHTGERPYKCDLCDQSYVSNSYLSHHLKRFHFNERPFVCEVCGNSYINASQLKIHFRTHTGERPFPCKECDKAFTTRSTLLRHSLVHTGEKAHKCDYCGKSFGKPYTLKVHVRIHTGEAPFKCNICEKAFRQKCSLQDHQKHHEKESSSSHEPHSKVEEKHLSEVTSGSKSRRKHTWNSSTSVLFNSHDKDSVSRDQDSDEVACESDTVKKRTFCEEPQCRQKVPPGSNLYENSATSQSAVTFVYQETADNDDLPADQTQSPYYWDVPSFK